MRKRIPTWIVLLVALAMTLAACGGDDAADDTPAPTGDDTADDGAADDEETDAEETDAEETEAEGTETEVERATVRIGVAAPISEHLLLWLGQDLGIYDEYGLDVELQLIPGGPEIIAGITGGSLDFGVFAAPSPQNAAARGADMTVIAEWVREPNLEFVVTGEIDSVEDLRGKSVAISAPGTTTAIFTDKLLRDNDLEVGTDVNVRNVGGQGEALSAFTSGQVDGAIFGAPVTNLALAQVEGSKVLVDYTDDYIWPYAILAAGEFPEENPDATLRFLEALQDVIQAFLDDPETAVEVVSRESNVDDLDLVRAAYERATQVVTTDLVPSEETNQAVLDEMAEAEDIGDLEVEDIIDTSFAEQLQ